jgi:hypothetical protein
VPEAHKIRPELEHLRRLGGHGTKHNSSVRSKVQKF